MSKIPFEETEKAVECLQNPIIQEFPANKSIKKKLSHSTLSSRILYDSSPTHSSRILPDSSPTHSSPTPLT